MVGLFQIDLGDTVLDTNSQNYFKFPLWWSRDVIKHILKKLKIVEHLYNLYIKVDR